MKTCATCRFFQPAEFNADKETHAGECHCNPPHKTSDRGHSYRPRILASDPACQFHSRSLPPAVNLPKAEVIRLEIAAEKGFGQTLRQFSETVLSLKSEPERLNTFDKADTPLPRAGRFYCWHEQSAGVRALMQELGLPHRELRPLREAAHVMGLSGGVLVDISNHPNQIPGEILVIMERAGMMRLRLSDEWLRSKAERMMGR